MKEQGEKNEKEENDKNKNKKSRNLVENEEGDGGEKVNKKEKQENGSVDDEVENKEEYVHSKYWKLDRGGCQEKISLSKRFEHEKKCLFALMLCPYCDEKKKFRRMEPM